MLKILLKAIVLFLIVLSVYLIVHPQACSNMLAGRETVLPVEGEAAEWRHPMAEPGRSITDPSEQSVLDRDELFTPVKSEDTAAVQDPAQPTDIHQKYSQDEIDYAIASHYVELEREYARTKTIGKDTATELSHKVMEDFHLSSAEWEAFLARATATGLFEKARRDLPPETDNTASVVK